ncbi:MAG: GNAT family N-acetyltransferase [Oscillospiraceae bacterium]|nr:GNAT family N-acetyltransferase [Oscillospiraceae bacterium]
MREIVFNAGIPDFKIRRAGVGDCADILRLIKCLATYEELNEEVSATKETLADSLFVKKEAEALLGEVNGEIVAYAIFFRNFSTFLGKACLYLEDLFVVKEHRGKGCGKAMFRAVAETAAAEGCERLDWCCLDWNKKSIDFYESMGAKLMKGWLVFRLEGDGLKKFAENAG